MQGHIRTERKCPKCGGNFAIVGRALTCPNCLTVPSRYFLDLWWQGRHLRIYKDSTGQVLDSFKRADRLLTHIRWEIDNARFDPARYLRTKYEPYFMENFAAQWLREQELRHRSGEIAWSTLSKYKKVIDNYVVKYFGRHDVRTITTREVKEFNLHLAERRKRSGKPMSAKFRADILGVLRQMYNDGLQSGELSRVQVPVFPRVNVPDPSFDILTVDEQDQVLSHIPEHDLPIYHFIVTYGVRPSEARALKRDAIMGDFESAAIRRTFTLNNKLRESPKEGKWRVIPILDETREILRRLPVSLTGFVFVNKWGRPYSQTYLNDTWNAACQTAGFRYIRLYHASRHSLGTRLANQGLGKEIIATVLGHSNTKTTSRYVRYASQALKGFFTRHPKQATVSKLPAKDQAEAAG